MSTPVSEIRQVVPDPRRRMVILLICSMSLLIVGLDVTIVNVALPSIRHAFHASTSGLQWTIDAYTLVLASLLMLSGSTADRLGRRRVFQIGLTTFSLGSLLCALAPNLGTLVAARVLQAIGGSMLNPVAMSIIRNVFVDPRERARAIGVWAGMVGISQALGPIVGGALVDSVGWRWVFLVNVPVGVTAIALTARYVPESRADRPRRIDPLGQALVIIALATLVYAIIEGPRAGWLSAQTLGLGAVATAAFVALVLVEQRIREPLVEVRFFRSVPFSGASATAIGLFTVQAGFLFLNTLYLQTTRGLSPLHAGIDTLPLAIPMLIAGPLTGRFIAAHGTRLPLLVAPLATIGGAAILTQVTAHTPFAELFGAYVLLGLSMGTINPPITNTAVSGMPPSMAGVAAAVASTSRQVGSTIGVAVFGAVVGGSAAGTVGAGAGFAAATHVAWWIAVGIGIVLLGCGVVSTTGWARGTATRAGELIERETSAEPAQTRAEIAA